MISAVPRARARNVRGGAVHAVPPGRQTIDIGEIPGASTAGLVDIGAEGQGNCAAMTSVPTATWMVVPLCAGVTVTVPCVVLGTDVGRRDGAGAADDVRPPAAEPDPEVAGAEGGAEVVPPCVPEGTVPVSDGVAGVVGVPAP